jgi:hypothetical protein
MSNKNLRCNEKLDGVTFVARITNTENASFHTIPKFCLFSSMSHSPFFQLRMNNFIYLGISI